MDKIRPQFLTILCILTFIGSAMGIFGAISNYTSAGMASGLTKDAMDEARDQIEEQSEDESATKIIGKIFDSVNDNITEDKIKNNSMASGVSNILTLVGAVLMWGLNKKGFWLYIIGALVGILGPLFIYDGIVGAIAGGGVAFISIIFCVLYYLNLKHLS